VSNALNPREQHSPVLTAALPRTDPKRFWSTATTPSRRSLPRTCVLRSATGRALLARLPVRSKRTPVQKAAGEAIVHLTATPRGDFSAAMRCLCTRAHARRRAVDSRRCASLGGRGALA